MFRQNIHPDRNWEMMTKLKKKKKRRQNIGKIKRGVGGKQNKSNASFAETKGFTTTNVKPEV